MPSAAAGRHAAGRGRRQAILGAVTSQPTPVATTGYPWPIESTRLANGLRVVVSEDRSAPVVCVNLWYDVGSRHEPPGQTGFAHLFEHLMFEGSVHVRKTEHMRLVQGNGGSLNATTNPDRTNYFETMPSEHLELALWLEADRMGGLVPALTQETLDNQREVVKNERRQRYENVPYGDAWLRLLPLLYPPGHPYHHATIGSMEDLNAASLDTFKAFHQQYYAPNNAVLTVVGDTRPDEVYALAEKYFRALEAVPDIPPAPGGGRGSRLYQRLADGLRIAQPDYVGAYGVDLAHAPAPLIVTATAKDGVDVEALDAGMVDVVASLTTEPVTEAELERAKALLTTSWWRQMSTVYGRADVLGRYATQFGDPGSAAYRLPAWQAVTADDVTTAAALTLKPGSRVTLTYVPQEAS